jgi:hypothetical protein
MGHTLQAQIKCTFRAVIKPYSMLILILQLIQHYKWLYLHLFIIFSTTCFGRKRNFRPKLVLNVVLMGESVIDTDWTNAKKCFTPQKRLLHKQTPLLTWRCQNRVWLKPPCHKSWCHCMARIYRSNMTTVTTLPPASDSLYAHGKDRSR